MGTMHVVISSICFLFRSQNKSTKVIHSVDLTSLQPLKVVSNRWVITKINVVAQLQIVHLTLSRSNVQRGATLLKLCGTGLLYKS